MLKLKKKKNEPIEKNFHSYILKNTISFDNFIKKHLYKKHTMKKSIANYKN